MYCFDNERHKAPHVHAKYQGQDASFSIVDGEWLAGEIPAAKARVVEARVLEHGSFQVKFADGLEGLIRFAPSAYRGVFAKLRDPAEFNKLYVNDYLSPGRGNLI